MRICVLDRCRTRFARLQYSYENHGRFLKHFSGLPGAETGYFVAPVQLPQGAILHSLTFQYKDTVTTGQAVADLERHTHDSLSTTLMAELVSSDTWAPGFGSASTTNFSPTPFIDNNLYSYYLGSTRIRGVAIRSPHVRPRLAGGSCQSRGIQRRG